MSLPAIPEGLPTSDVVLSHFGKFQRAFPVASSSPDCVKHFGTFLRHTVSPQERALILERAKYPL